MNTEYKYTVATHCFTYNQALYIEDALKGFSMQEALFPAVFIIVDDASTDGEANMLREWASVNLILEEDAKKWQDVQYGELIVAPLKNKPYFLFVILLLSENHYTPEKKPLKYEYIKEWDNEAKYIAICEGDDYWIDSKKLQKQVNFLDDHKDYSLCFTDKLVLKADKQYHDVESDTYLRNLSDFRPVVINGGYIYTATMLFRNSMYQRMPKAFNDHRWLMTDFQMRIELLHEGKFKYLPEITTIYRILEDSASHFKSIERAMAFQESAYNARCYYCNHYEDMKEFQYWSDCYYCNMGLTIACRFHKWEYISRFIYLAKDKNLISFGFLAKHFYIYIIEYPFVIKIRKFLTNNFLKKRHGLQEV